MTGAGHWRVATQDRGSGTVLTVAIMMVLVLMAAVGVWISGWLGCMHQARNAADLGAVAGAQAHQLGGDGCAVARATAELNGGQLSECEVTTGAGEFIVDVQVEVELRPQVRGGPTRVTEQARAGVVSTRE